MNSFGDSEGTFSAKPRTGMIMLLIGLSLVMSHIPILSWFLQPINTFIAAVHELSHALACILTGGTVAGMTIVGDGAGHGGLTFCSGGIQQIYAQAGYMGTALFGCLLIILGRMPKISKGVLFTMGVCFGIASLTFMFGTVLHGNIIQGVLSMISGLLMAGAFIIVSLRFNAYWANLILLFIGVQTGLNAVNSITWLFNPAGSSDADAMFAMTGVPSIVWSSFWLLFAVSTLGATLWWSANEDTKSLNSI